MLGVIVNAYKEFESRVKLLTAPDLSKAARIREIMKNHVGTITKSKVAIQRALEQAQLLFDCLMQKYFGLRG